MARITTVLGDIDSSKLGHCQPHEHVYILEIPAVRDDTTAWLNNLPRTVEELKAYKEVGGASIMDPQPVGTGRDAQALKTISKLSGVHIIGCTGYHIPYLYTEDHWVFSAPEDELVDLFVDEIENGMYLSGCYEYPTYQTDIRAGGIKAMLLAEGIHSMDGKVEHMLRATGRAAVKTGTPLMIHTEYGQGVQEALDLLEGVGLPLEHVIICHVDRREMDFSVPRDILKRGAYLEIDSVDLFGEEYTDYEVALMRDMIESGYEDQLLCATDSMADRMKSYGGKYGIDFILTYFLPKLAEAGISQEVLHKIMVSNPARALARF